MSERRFAKGLGKPGTAAQLRETVSQAVKETTVLNKPHIVEPLDFENFLQKNRTLFQNDPQRELLLYPPDDISEVVLPRRYRTRSPTCPKPAEIINSTLLTKQCISTYSSNWSVVHYKYNSYSKTYVDLPKLPQTAYKEESYEVDYDVDTDEDALCGDSVTKEGYLFKGPEVGAERTFVNIGSKSFKRRFCSLRQQVDGTYILEMYKDERKGEAKVTIVMDFCTEVVKNGKRGRFCFELRMTAGHKSYLLAAENEVEFQDWLGKFTTVLQQNRAQEEKRANSQERENNTTPPPSPQINSFGTLKGLEHSMNPELNKYARETDTSIALARREGRDKLLPLYPQLAVNFRSIPSSNHTPLEPYKEVFGTRVLVKFESVRFRLHTVDDTQHLCQIEPYYISMCLFDARAGKKLTENFHFDVNEMSTTKSQNGKLEMNGCHEVPPQWLLHRKQAILNVTNPHSDVFVVVRIEKVLQGGVNQTSEPYVRANKDPHINPKVYRNIQNCCQKLSNYRMPFVWTAKPLFRIYSNELDTSCEFPGLFRQDISKHTDEEMIKLLTEYRKPDRFSKFTVIPGFFSVKISTLNELPPNTLTSSFAPLKPFSMPPVDEPTIEVTEFEGNSEKDVHPYATFSNHLYVYPLCLKFDTQKLFTRARNIACVVELRDSDTEDCHILQCIYGRPGQSLLVNRMTCAVLHHNVVPTWYEEVKIRLPINLTVHHHLLFTFYHISCDMIKKCDNAIENCVGFAWAPLLQKGRLNVDLQILPVAGHLPPHYLSIQPLGLGKGNCGPDVNWVDGQKPIFSVAFTLASTVNTNDQHLLNLFAHAERLLDTKPSAQPSESETCKVLKALHAIQSTTLITFLPTLLNQLFALLVAVSSEEICLNIIRVLINLVNMMCEMGRKDILDTYVKFVYVNPNSRRSVNVHDEICKYLPVLLNTNNMDFLVVNKFMHHSHFFFDIIVKGMAQFLLSSSRIKMQRNERFSTEYLQKIETVIHILITYIHTKYKEIPIETKELNKNLAHFIKQLLSIMDRGFAFRLIKIYLEKFDPSDARLLQEYKFNFLEIICNHEHYISFNLPVQHTKLSPKSRYPDKLQEFTLCEQFCRHHFIVGILLQEVRASLNDITPIRNLALNILRNLLVKHELDDRYSNKGQRNRIALLYVPWLSVVLENFNRLDIEVIDEDTVESKHGNGRSRNGVANRMSSSSSYLFGKCSTASDPAMKSVHQFSLLIDKDSPLHIRNLAFLDAIAGQSMVNGKSISIESDIASVDGNNSAVSQDTLIIRENGVAEKNGDVHLADVCNGHSHTHSQSQIQRYDKLQIAEVKDTFIIFLFVIKYLSEDQLISLWQQYSEADIVNFFTILEMSLHCFKYVGAKSITLVKSNSNDLINKNSKKAHTLPARMNPPEIPHDNTSTLIIHMEKRDHFLNNENEVHRKDQAILEQHLSSEVGLIVLDCMGLYLMNFRKNLLHSNGDNDIMRKIFDTFLSFLQVGQSDKLYKHYFAALRAFVNGYSHVLFQGNAILCGRLCYEILKCCNSRLAPVRQESCAILYLLMRSNFEFTGRKGLTRVHLQVIISVSQMLGNVVICLNNSRFQESLSLINSYASSDKAMKGTGFPIEVKDLTKRIRTVLMATVQMREYNHDPEMLADLELSLANSYDSTPELRHTWLETMTRKHVRDENYSEAACCQLHIAALMSEYLKLKNIQEWGAERFAKMSSNIVKDEKGLKFDAGIQDSQYTEFILLEQLESCAEFIDKAERYEIMGELYKLIIPVYERTKNFEALTKCYRKLAENYDKVLECNKSGRRLLGRYYRVGFYGQAYFENECGQEYVYKEPKVTSLSEITERLRRQYSNKYGQHVVMMIRDSNPVQQRDLDAKFAYIQVTHVTPYAEKDEIQDRQTDFEQNHNISTFMFETPFTKDGKTHGTPENQWKRRTVIKTEYSFPYVKKRIRIISRSITELSPIDVAIDEMQTRVTELEDVVFAQTTDVKKLQLLLQGSVCVQVNAGPLAYASVFLEPILSTLYPEDKVEELKDIYREFLKICYSALQINGRLIVEDQQEYQEVLKENYKKLCSSLSTLISETLWPHDDIGSFKRNSLAMFSIISGTSQNSSIA